MSPAPRPRSGHHNPRSLHAAGLLVRPACRQRALYKVKTLLASLMLIYGDTGTPRGPDVLAHSGVTRDTRATSRYPPLCTGTILSVRSARGAQNGIFCRVG